MKEQKRDKRVVIFKIIALLLPCILFFLIEFFLRVINYGDDLTLFKADVTGKYYYLNPQVGKRYFTNIRNATTGNIDFFKKVKTPETYRIFVLGSSTSLGFPYMYNGAFPRMLKYKLQRLYPEKNFEIINLSLSAINSYAVLDMAGEVVNYQPDAVLVYCGQNEYHGALGIASSGSLGSSSIFIKTFIWSKRFRLMQLIYNIANLNKNDEISTDLHKTLMERMAFGQKIEFGSEKYNRGVTQFKSNITAIFNLFNKAKIQVYIGNLVTNEKDLHPFESSIQSDSLKINFDLAFDKANTLLIHGDSLNALKTYFSALTLDSMHAECCYRIGTLAYGKGDYKLARTFFIKAKEYDNIRFRAPEEFNRIIEAKAHEFDNVKFVNVKLAFEEVSPHGIIGNELLLEHVHPNLKGYHLMADAFLKEFIETQYEDVHSINYLPENIIDHQLPVSKFDTIYGYISTILLRENWPFNEPLPAPTKDESTYEGKIAGGLAVKQFDWEEAMNKLLEHYLGKNQYEASLIIAEGLCLEFPYNAKYFEMAAKLALQARDDDRYFFYMLKIWMEFTQNYQLAEQLFITALRNDKPELAMPFLDYSIQNTNKNQGLNIIKSTAKQIIALKMKLNSKPDDLEILNQIAALYIEARNFTAAQKYIKSVFLHDPKNKVASGLLSQLKQNEGEK